MIISGTPSQVIDLLEKITLLGIADIEGVDIVVATDDPAELSEDETEISRDEHEARKAVRRDMEREWYRQADEAEREAEAQAQDVEWVCDKWLDVGLLVDLAYGCADPRELDQIDRDRHDAETRATRRMDEPR